VSALLFSAFLFFAVKAEMEARSGANGWMNQAVFLDNLLLPLDSVSIDLYTRLISI